ncbi:hypothetical protein ASPZODRAFT_55748 [Penicilliopsis zonata CBS 506.65]|uniref:magnesium chelatase n=1 Tax=Penicilliopsis zonata CBS 506.65 TaxID=1073090 RepID=A0A1L9SV74_9EURO|nr:hypothetical protein ASPZODRAFT_55748 [Penicilliopsis zonata CBS 506.65]OJJ51088.1 hypothetical protein ASPZODRAFT_55748 [Penicilliopsis zonata CBS 506.65]
MDDIGLEELALELSDLEVAVLLCLVAREHCLIETTSDSVHDVAKELALICSNVFGLSYAVLDCSAATSYDDFTREILAPDARRSAFGQSALSLITAEQASNFTLHGTYDQGENARSLFPGYSLDQRKVVNVVIAKNFNYVDEDIQAQALELMRSRQILTESAILEATEEFVFIPIITEPPGKVVLNQHLNDHLLISHFHDPQDGYMHLEEDQDWLSDASIVKKSDRKQAAEFRISREVRTWRADTAVLETFRQESDRVTVTAQVTRYIQDIVVFLRLSRAVAGGVSSRANMHLLQFSKLLAPLHGVDYLTPSLVALATKKVFRHRLAIARPEDDRSLQYGSDLQAVSRVLEGLGPETILDNVLSEIEVPL